jgi:hypothetical protein
MLPITNYIRDLEKGKEDWIITTRVSRKWESLNTKTNNFLISLDLLLLDGNDDMIHATIPSKWVKLFRPLIDESLIYEIGRFSVLDNKPRYKVLRHKIMIQFMSGTSIKVVPEESYSIIRHRFDFVPFHMIPTNYLTDGIGRVIEIGSAEDQN